MHEDFLSNKLKSNNKWVKTLEINEELWQKTMEETLHGILKLLESAEILLENGGDSAISAGLYTYAVEEYGKILVLKQSKHLNGQVKIKYKNKFRDHSTKFRAAIENLPSECITIGLIGFEEGFENGFQRKKTLSDWEARLAVFYCDFEDSGEDIKPPPPVSIERLRNAIVKLREITLSTPIP